MSKYYTPTIEEFHIGFEYEELVNFDMLSIRPDNHVDRVEWCKMNLQDFQFMWLSDIKSKLTFEGIRVKYLDEKDIEDLGFTKLLANIYTLKDKVKGPIRLQYFENDNYLAVFYPEYNNTGTHLFQGIIKNKSELMQLLTQLEING